MNSTFEILNISLYSSLGLVSLIGHILVLLIIALCLRQRRVLDELLMLLSITHIICMIWFLPFQLHRQVSSDHALHYNICPILHTVLANGTSIAANIKLLIGTSRASLCCSETLYKQLSNKKIMFITLGIISACSIGAINMPIFIGSINITYSIEHKQCQLEASDGTLYSYVSIIHTFFLFLPVLLNAICYICVLVALNRVRKQHPDIVKELHEIILTSGLIITNLFICWVPILILSTVDPGLEKLPKEVNILVTYLFLVDIAFEPLLYAFRIKDYRKGLRILIHNKECPRDPIDEDRELDFNELKEDYRCNIQAICDRLDGEKSSKTAREKWKIQKLKCVMNLRTVHNINNNAGNQEEDKEESKSCSNGGVQLY